VAVTVRLPEDVDLHARPAADFVRAAMGFGASVQVAAGQREVDAKSLLSVLALGAKGGTDLRLTASGEDAAAALEALSARVATLSD
jgi:phosphotransferase system HPr (HPr) family protein